MSINTARFLQRENQDIRDASVIRAGREDMNQTAYRVMQEVIRRSES